MREFLSAVEQAEHLLVRIWIARPFPLFSFFFFVLIAVAVLALQLLFKAEIHPRIVFFVVPFQSA